MHACLCVVLCEPNTTSTSIRSLVARRPTRDSGGRGHSKANICLLWVKNSSSLSWKDKVGSGTHIDIILCIFALYMTRTLYIAYSCMVIAFHVHDSCRVVYHGAKQNHTVKATPSICNVHQAPRQAMHRGYNSALRSPIAIPSSESQVLHSFFPDILFLFF